MFPLIVLGLLGYAVARMAFDKHVHDKAAEIAASAAAAAQAKVAPPTEAAAPAKTTTGGT